MYSQRVRLNRVIKNSRCYISLRASLHNYKLNTADWFWMRVNARDYIRNKEFFEINQSFPDISSISATEEVSLLSKFRIESNDLFSFLICLGLPAN
jgi:hypothetical protein